MGILYKLFLGGREKKQFTQTLYGTRKSASPRTLLSFSWYPDSALKSFLGAKSDGNSVFLEVCTENLPAWQCCASSEILAGVKETNSMQVFV